MASTVMSDDRPPARSTSAAPHAAAVVGVVAATVLVTLTVAVLIVDGPLRGEIEIIRRLQDLGGPAAAFADVLRFTTGTEGNLIIGLVPAVWVIRRHGRRGVAAVAICLAAMLVVQPVAKELIDRDRPDEEQVDVRAEHTSKSYPSGHSLSTTTVFGAAALYAARRGRRGWALLIAVPIPCTAVASGIHGVHWASDAIAGTIIGGFAAWSAVAVLQLPPPTSIRRAQHRPQ